MQSSCCCGRECTQVCNTESHFSSYQNRPIFVGRQNSARRLRFVGHCFWPQHSSTCCIERVRRHRARERETALFAAIPKPICVANRRRRRHSAHTASIRAASKWSRLRVSCWLARLRDHPKECILKALRSLFIILICHQRDNCDQDTSTEQRLLSCSPR